MRTSIRGRRPRHALVGSVLALLTLGAGAAGCGQGGSPALPPASTTASAEVSAPAGKSVVAPMPESEPLSLGIPALGVTSKIMELGLQDDGSMEVPPGAYPAGWYTGSPTPGELGPAIVAAHVDWNGDRGVFFELHEMQPGQEITVRRRDGSTAVFRVDDVAQYPKHEFPTEAVYGDIGHAGLRLITCGGDFDDDAGSYVDNIVVYASLVGLEG